MAEHLHIAPTVDLALPAELVALEWIEVDQQQTVEQMARSVGSAHRVVTEDEPLAVDEQVIAERTRFAIVGVALGAHPDLGTVTHEAGQSRTRIGYVVVFTPWISTEARAAFIDYLDGRG